MENVKVVRDGAVKIADVVIAKMMKDVDTIKISPGEDGETNFYCMQGEDQSMAFKLEGTQTGETKKTVLYELLSHVKSQVHVHIYVPGFDNLEQEKCGTATISNHELSKSGTVFTVKNLVDKLKRLVENELSRWVQDQSVQALANKLPTLNNVVTLFDWLDTLMLQRKVSVYTVDLSEAEIKTLIIAEQRYLSMEHDKWEFRDRMNAITDRDGLMGYLKNMRIKRNAQPQIKTETS